MTQDELARAARRFGLKWTASKVRDFEVGRSAPTFATVLAVTAALTHVASTSQQGDVISVRLAPVRLADLLSFDGQVAITNEFSECGDRLVDFCSGGVWQAATVIDWREASGLTEDRIAASLEISADRLAAESQRLWNTTFSAERDRIAGPNANAQRKGQVTRQLKAELKKVITDGDD